MSDLSRKTASIYINHSSAEEALKSLQKQADILQQKIKKGADAGKNMVGEIAKLNKVQDSIKGVQHQIDNGLRPSFNQLQTTVSRLRNELKRMSEDAPGYAEKFKAFNKASTELDRLGNNINKVKVASGGLSSTLSSLVSTLGPIGLVVAAIGLLKGSIDEALQSEKAVSRLKNTLDNLGDADVFERLSRKADDMAARFKFIDNDDVIGVFEQLITYGKLTEDQINKLTPVIVDFAAKSRISISESTSLIIKALEGNGKALKEYGINIKDAGTEGERLNIILTTLKEKVNGAADAFGETTQGKIASTTQRFRNLKEELGNKLLPIINYLLDRVNKLADALIRTADRWDFSHKTGLGAQETVDIMSGQKNLEGGRDTQAQLRAEQIRKQKRPMEELNTLLDKQTEKVNKLKVAYDQMLEGKVDGKLVLQTSADRVSSINAAYLKFFDARVTGEALQLLIGEKTKLGIGGNTDNTNGANVNKTADEAIDRFKALQKEIEDLLKRNQDNYNKETLSPFEYSLLQIFTDFDKDLAKFQSGLKAGVLSKKAFDDAIIQLEIIKINKINDLYAKNPDNPLVKKTATAAQLAARSTPEIDAAVLTEELKGNATKKVRHRITAEQVVEQAKNAAALYDAFSSIQNNKDQAAIAAKNAQADKERNAAKRQLDAKLIDQATYDAKIKSINDKNNKAVEAIEKKQFERQKRMQIIQAVINGAEGITATIAKNGMPAAIPFIAISAAITGAQIAAIASQKYIPKYARGGVFDGPAHSHGGMPVVNPRTGRKVAELEGGEPILSRRTYANNKSIVDALLHSSMYNGGATIIPGWQQRSYSGINWGMVNNRVQQVRRFERGGVFTASGSTVTDNGELSSILKQLFTVLSQPIKTYTLYSEQNAAAELDAKVKAATTFSRN